MITNQVRRNKMFDFFDLNGFEPIINHATLGVFSYFGINPNDIDIEIGFVSKNEIKELNRENRNIDKETDVLSFPAIAIKLPFFKEQYKDSVNPESDGVILGAIYICLEVAKMQALEYKHSVLREVAFLVVHGILHLLGFDHEKTEDCEIMEKLQGEIMNKLGINRDLNDDQIKKLIKDNELISS